MTIETTRQFSRTLARVAAALLVVSAMFAHADDGIAHQAAIFAAPESRVAQLEKVFWMCDYTATTRGVYATPMEMCSAATDDLKNEKFGGDFLELHKWWQQNKPAEHQKLAARAQ